MSIIDTLTAGFNATIKRLWLVIVPVALDLFLWLGPKLSIGPVVDRLVAFLRQGMQAAGSASMDANLTEMFEGTLTALQETVGRTNLFALLAWGRLGVPSVAGIAPIDVESDRVIVVAEYWQMLLLQVGIMAAGLLVACLFLVLLADYAAERRPELGRFPRQVLLAWFYLAVIFIPLGFFLIFALSFSLLLGPLSIFVGVLFVWLMIYMSFVPQAVALGESNPLKALISSFTIVRLNFWSTLGLILLVNVINTGLSLVWVRLLMKTAVGTLAAILVNAYVGTSLTLSIFMFYRDRLARWQQFMRERSASHA